MAAYNKFNCFVADMANKKHNLGSDVLKVALCAAANAPVATNTVYTNLTAVAVTNLDSVTLTVSSSSQTAGTYTLVVADKTMTAAGAVGPFRYIVVYNDTATNKELICWFDNASEVTLASGDTFKLDFGASLFSLA